MATNYTIDEVVSRRLQEQEQEDLFTLRDGFRRRHVPTSRNWRVTPNLGQTHDYEEDDSVIILDEDGFQPVNLETLRELSKKPTSEAISDLNTESDEMLARRLQAKFDSELAESLMRHEERRQAARSALRREGSGFNSLPDDDNVESTDSRPRTRSHRASNNNNKSTNSTVRVPPSFETDILYSMARNSRANTNRSLLRYNDRNTHSTATLDTLDDDEWFDVYMRPRGSESELDSGHFQHNFRSTRTSNNAPPRISDNDPISNLSTAFTIDLANNLVDSRTQFNLAERRQQRGNRDQNFFQTQFRPGFRNPTSSLNVSNRDFTPDDYEILLRLDDINSVKRALSKSEVDSLPCFDYKTPSTGKIESDNANTCSICYEEYAQHEKLMALTCTHKFHKACIQKWLQESRRCPLCQKDAISGE